MAINTERTVFILGAGASVSAGVPVMNDFWDTARKRWKTGKLDKYERDFELVEKAQSALIGTHSRVDMDYTNLESFVTAIEMAGILQKLPGFDAIEIEDLKKSIKRVIVATIEEELRFGEHEKQVIPPDGYDDFAVLLSQLNNNANPNHTTSILTFNYDIGLDFSLKYQGIGPEYCLTENINEDAVKLLKLHGSTNWLEKKEETIEDGEPMIDYIPFRKYLQKVLTPADLSKGDLQLKMSESINLAMGGSYKHIPFVAPPSWNKHEYHKNLSNVWQMAATELSKAENLIIIGFSMPNTDLFFKNLFALGMAGGANLQNLWVFNPDTSLKEKYEYFLGPTSKHRYSFNPHPKNDKEIPDKYKEVGTLKYAIHSIASHFGLENQFPNSFWVA